MARLWQQIIKSERGQALPVVLILLVLGGLMVVPSLDYATTSLDAGRTLKQNLRGVYAADAGVEYVLRQLKNGIVPDTELPLPINGLEVTMETEELKKPVAFVNGGFVETGNQHWWIDVDGEMLEEGGGIYEYTITATRHPEALGAIALREVGVSLPPGFSYQAGSAADPEFTNNLSDGEPDILDEVSAYMLNWDSLNDTPNKEVVKTQTFYISGEASEEEGVAWVRSGSSNIAVSCEVSGTLYTITATATRPGESEVIIAEVTADVLWYSEAEVMNTILWQINP